MSPVGRLLTALLGAAALLGVPACSEAAGPTRTEYAAMADDLCTAADEELDEVYMDRAVDVLNASTTGEDDVYAGRSERWVRAKVVPEYEQLASALKSIPPPDGEATYLTDLYGDFDARVEMLHRRPSDGRAAIESDAQLRDRFAGYGIEMCPPAHDEAPDWEDPAKVLEEAQEREEERQAPPTGSEEEAAEE